MTTPQPRQPGGTPAGGQFAPDRQQRAEVTLPDTAVLARLTVLSRQGRTEDEARAQARIFLETAEAQGLTEQEAVEYAEAIGAASTGALYELVSAGVSVQEYRALKEIELRAGLREVDDRFAYRAAEMARIGVTAERWQQVMDTYGLQPYAAQHLYLFDPQQLAPWMAAARSGELTRFSAPAELNVLIRSGMSVEQAIAWAASPEPMHRVLTAHRAGEQPPGMDA